MHISEYLCMSIGKCFIAGDATGFLDSTFEINVVCKYCMHICIFVYLYIFVYISMIKYEYLYMDFKIITKKSMSYVSSLCVYIFVCICKQCV